MSKTGFYKDIRPTLEEVEDYRHVATAHGPLILTDGGHTMYFKARFARDCVARAVAVATDLDYKLVYDRLAVGEGGRFGTVSARDGIHTTDEWFIEMMKLAGFVWTELEGVLAANMPPSRGVHIVCVPRHYMAYVDGVWYDAGSSSLSKSGQVIEGYWTLKSPLNKGAFKFEKRARRAARKWVYEYGYCDRSIEALNKRWTWSTDVNELMTHAYKNFTATAEQPVPFFKCKRTRATLGGYTDEETFATEHNANTNEWASQWDWETKWTPPKPFAEKVHVCCTRFKLFGIKKV